MNVDPSQMPWAIRNVNSIPERSSFRPKQRRYSTKTASSPGRDDVKKVVQPNSVDTDPSTKMKRVVQTTFPTKFGCEHMCSKYVAHTEHFRTVTQHNR